MQLAPVLEDMKLDWDFKDYWPLLIAIWVEALFFFCADFNFPSLFLFLSIEYLTFDFTFYLICCILAISLKSILSKTLAKSFIFF